MKTALDVTVEVDIARPREAVWQFLAAAEHSPEWLDEFIESHLISGEEPHVGSQVSYTIEPGPRTGTYALTEWDPPRRLAWDGPPLAMMRGGGRPRGFFELTERDGRTTHLVCAFQPELIGPPVLLKPYLKRWLRKQRGRDVLKLKAILEADGR